MNEVKAGIRSKIPEKPDTLRFLSLIEMFGTPPVSGGVLDQPHLMMTRLANARARRDHWNAINAAAERANQR